MKPAFASLFCLTLLACGPAKQAPPVPRPVSTNDGLLEREVDTCGATEAYELAGHPPEAVKTAGLTKPYRIITPGSIITQEYLSERVNFYLDDKGLIYRVTCG